MGERFGRLMKQINPLMHRESYILGLHKAFAISSCLVEIKEQVVHINLVISVMVWC